MGYFLPSFVQKRILRYALSRLELLETRDLDLENLEIAWGKRSTIELRDIGISRIKLSALLRLPPGLTLSKARVSFLRVTIPADLYNSGILVEIDGVHLGLDTDSPEDKAERPSPTPGTTRTKGVEKSARVDRPTRTQTKSHDRKSTTGAGAGSLDEGGQSEILPSTVDLAQSFLQAEPPQERAGIQAAVANSQNLNPSLALSEGDDDSTALGVGSGVSLPGFLAEFLKRVGSRLELHIKNVDISIDTQIELPPEDLDSQDNTATWEYLTIRFSVEKVDIDGVTDRSVAESSTTYTTDELRGEEKHTFGAHHAVRHIALYNIQCLLVSDTSLFTNLSRFSVPASPNTTKSGTSKASSYKTRTSGSQSDPRFAASSSQGRRSEGVARTGWETNDSVSASQKENFYSLGRRDDVDEHCQSRRLDEHSSEFGESQYQDSVLTGSFYSDLEDSQLDMKRRTSNSKSEKHYRSNQRRSPSTSSRIPHTLQDSESALFFSDQITPEVTSSRVKSEEDTVEDLADSKIFSHEEAQSMYMSAMSQGVSQDNRGHRNMPGDWESSSSEDEIQSTNVKASRQLPIDHVRRNTQSLESAVSVGITAKEETSLSEVPRLKTSAETTVRAEVPAIESLSSVKQTSSNSSRGSSAKSDSGLFVLKKIMSIDSITIDIPQNDGSSATFPPSRSHGHQPVPFDEMPGTFSRGQSEPKSQDLGPSTAAEGLRKSPAFSNGTTKQTVESSTSVRLGDITILGDIGLTKLAIMVIQRFMDLANQKSQEKKAADPVATAYYCTKIAVRKVSWQFLDLVRGFTTAESPTTSTETRVPQIPGDGDVLLKAMIRDLKVSVERQGQSLASETSIRKLVFGYATDTVLAFDNGLKLRESNRDILGPIDHDLILKVSKSPERTQIELTTLPLHIHLDLRRLDETFSWFGGFSSILGLGSSVISTVTVTDTKPKISDGKQSRVRFADTTTTQQREVGSLVQRKITARLGGIVFDMEGNSSSFRLETSAVKLVSRAEGIGLSVDRLNITGPYVVSRRQEPSINVRLAGLRAEYLSNPKEVDLTRLLALLCPSNDNYEQDDDILVDTLLRQRRQGGVVRITVDSTESHVHDISDLKELPALGNDLKKLSTVAKYLPEDDRPGIMTLFLIRETQIELNVGRKIGTVEISAKNMEAAHISLPSLVAVSIGQLEVRRNHVEELVGAVSETRSGLLASPPMIMARFVGNALEPTIKMKLQGLRAEYHVTTALAVLNSSEEAITEHLVADMMSSIATVTAQADSGQSPVRSSAQIPSRFEDSKPRQPPLALDLVLRDVVVGLNPRESASRGIVVLSQARTLLASSKDDELSATLEVNKASLLAIDDIACLRAETPVLPPQTGPLQHFSAMGYVSLSEISAAKVTIQIDKTVLGIEKAIDVELRDALVVIESCADSTQTLQTMLSGLKPPLPPSKDLKYRTEVMPVEDMLASFSGEAFATQERGDYTDYYSPNEEANETEDEGAQDLEFVSSFYGDDPESEAEDASDSIFEGDIDSVPHTPRTLSVGQEMSKGDTAAHSQIVTDESTLDFREDHFGNSSTIGGTAHRWDTLRNTYELADDSKLRASPFRLRIRGVHVIWNLYDGYDWQHTRDTIGQAVAAVEIKAAEKRSRRSKRRSIDVEEEEDSVIGDFLFNSIYIGISANHDPKDLSRQINRNLDDLGSESGSYATSTASSGSPNRQGRTSRGSSSRKLRLTRSKSHKMTFEVKGLAADVVVFPPDSGQNQSSMDIRVQDFEIFDHLPTSTWKKFATYMHDAGERESGTSMIHIEILNVKPVPDLAASEIILKATVLPLRLHVDQDALDFMTRFFEFKDASAAPSTSKTEPPFLQRAEVRSIRVKLDFKPKRIDYAGLRSGHTTEFMNFFILDQADMVLRRVIIHGVSGFDKLGKMLNDIWTPDVKNNQLPGVLAGLAPVRSLANVGSGVRDLVVIPIREYRKDGRVVRSVQKGALAFAKTTTSELAKLGAKLAIGTQTVLQGAEDLLAPEQQRMDVSAGWEDADMDDEEKKQISLYADQPVGVMQGLRGGYASLERDLLMAKDAIIAMPGEVMDSGTAGGAARAVLRGAPTVILRPALGVSKAVGQTLMGATNSLDPANRRRVDDKYKRH